jgi:flagellar protein FlaI
MHEDFSYFLGLFAGDGWFQSRGISIGTNNEKESLRIKKLMRQLFQKEPIVKKRIYKDGHKMYIISLYSVELEKKIRDLLKVPAGEKSKIFKIPKEIQRTNNLMRNFISGLFDAESWKYDWYSRKRISMEISNEPVLELISNFIKKDGIKVSGSKRKSRNLFRIDITGEPSITLFEELYRLRAGKS